MFTMKTILLFCFCGISPLMGGTVVITSLSDEQHPLAPLCMLDGSPLLEDAVVMVGAFPGLSDDEILNESATGSYSQVATAFRPFGKSCAIGEGAAGSSGDFEIAVREALVNETSPWNGEEVSVLIQRGNGAEFLVARFKGIVFEADSDTGLESFLSLHLASAKVIVGNCYGGTQITTTPPPSACSFNVWIEGFRNITNAGQRLPEADADGDGRSNLLEYATGGNPSSPTDLPPCQIIRDEGGDYWVRFSRVVGVGSIRHTIEFSTSLDLTWKDLLGDVELDPNPPDSEFLKWMRMKIPAPLGANGFFRIKHEADDLPLSSLP
jgi:hypothetical protein